MQRLTWEPQNQSFVQNLGPIRWGMDVPVISMSRSRLALNRSHLLDDLTCARSRDSYHRHSTFAESGRETENGGCGRFKAALQESQ